MAADAADRDVEEIRAGHARSGERDDAPRLQIGRVVQAIDLVAGKTLKQPVGQHGARAAEPFFRRLKDEDRCAVEIARLGEVTRRAEQDRRVPVVTAAVETIGDGRSPRQIGLLLHRQRVHVGSQADAARAAATALEHADDPGSADAAMDLDAPLRQFVGDDAGGAAFLEAYFRMGVEVAADGGQFVGESVDAGDCRHESFSLAPEVIEEPASGDGTSDPHCHARPGL